MADAGAGLDAGYGRVLHAGADQPGAAAGDQQIDQSRCRHQLVRALTAGVLQNPEDRRIASGVGNAVPERLHDGHGGAVRLLAAAQDADVPALEAERRRIRGDIRAALIDDGDQSKRHLHLLNAHPVRAREVLQHAARMSGQRGDGAHAVGHPLEPLFVQAQPVEHDLRDGAARGLQIEAVRRQNGL